MVLSLCLAIVDQVQARLVKKLGRPLTEQELWDLCLAVELDWDNYFNGVGGVPQEPHPEDYGEHDLHWYSHRPQHTREECPYTS